MDTIVTDPLLDERNAAQVLGLKNYRTLNIWRQRRVGPSYTRIGENIRYPLSELMSYIASRTVRHPQPAAGQPVEA